MRYFKSIFYKVCLFLLLLLAVAVFFIATTPGSRLSVRLAGMVLPGQLQFSQIDGTWLQGVTLHELMYSDSTIKLHLQTASITWSILPSGELTLTLDHPHIRLLQMSTSGSNKTPNTFKPPAIPFAIKINGLVINKLMVNQTVLNNVSLQASATLTRLDMTQLRFDYANQPIVVQATGELQSPYAITATLHVLPRSSTKDNLEGDISFTGDKNCYTWQGSLKGMLPMTFKGTLLNLTELKTELLLAKNKMTLAGTIPNHLDFTASMADPAALHPALAGLTTHIKVTGQLNQAQYGQLTVVIDPGSFRPPKDMAFPVVPFHGGTFLIDLNPKALHASGLFTLNATQSIDMSLRLPGFNGQDLSHQAVDGRLNLQVNSLDFLQGMSPFIAQPHGQLSATLTLAGTIGHPDVQGAIHLLNGGISIPDAGIVLNALQAHLITHDHHWELKGSVRDQGMHDMTVKGQGDFSPKLTGQIQVDADHFLALNTAEYSMSVSPQITVSMANDALNITGTVRIPTAKLKPVVLGNTVNVTDDIVFVRENSAKKAQVININTDVAVEIGDDVIIDTQGLHGMLAGALQLKQTAGGSMSAVGVLAIREGTYKAYGQDLKIKHGEFLFSGGTLTNPKINLRAARSFDNTSQFSGSNQLFDFNASNLHTIDFGNHLTVGVQVMGNLNDPKVKLYSVPASLSQADILSMLVLGKPASQASQSGGQLLLTAASEMKLDSGTKGTQLLSQLKHTLGVDLDLQNRSNPNNSAGDTSLMVGKTISKRLYLSYNIGILQESANVLTLKYLLNKYFSVQVTTSSVENGLDVLYTSSIK